MPAAHKTQPAWGLPGLLCFPYVGFTLASPGALPKLPRAGDPATSCEDPQGTVSWSPAPALSTPGLPRTAPGTAWCLPALEAPG